MSKFVDVDWFEFVDENLDDFVLEKFSEPSAMCFNFRGGLTLNSSSSICFSRSAFFLATVFSSSALNWVVAKTMTKSWAFWSFVKLIGAALSDMMQESTRSTKSTRVKNWYVIGSLMRVNWLNKRKENHESWNIKSYIYRDDLIMNANDEEESKYLIVTFLCGMASDATNYIWMNK
jgi:hypothetical protein